MAELNVRNRTIFHGDNLEFLRGINSETIHLIATDPPFKKGRDFHATPGSLSDGASFKDRWSWEQDVQGDWVDKIKDDWPAAYAVIESTRLSYGEDMSAFLCWLGVRVMEMRRVLRQDGSLYLHIDHTAHAYVKALLDAIFGYKNFRNEIVWHYYNIANVARKHFGRKHDSILWYSKSVKSSFNWDDMREDYSPNSNWVRSSESYGDDRYKPDKRGKLMHDVWRLPTINNMAKERTGYPTQKPLALYERIIKASSNEGDFVLDPFCGCATTPVAAERLGRQWIGIDIWDKAHDTVLSRLERNGLAVPTRETKEDQPNLFTFGDVTYSAIPPTRTDDNEIAAPRIKHKIPIPKEKWEMLSHKQMKKILSHFQRRTEGDPLITCAGCGRELEQEFMELDHISPKSDGGANSITNRILICRPCNGTKSNGLTITGLRNANRKRGWMKDKTRAQWAMTRQSEAVDHAKLFQDDMINVK